MVVVVVEEEVEKRERERNKKMFLFLSYPSAQLPPLPDPVGSPACATSPGRIRWKSVLL